MKKLILLVLASVFALFASVICLPERVLATDNSTNAQKLMNSYYNAGKYSKHTEIFYIGAAGGSYDSSCFHAGVGNLIRDTEYVPGNLYMTNSEKTINSGYKDVDGGMAHYKKVGGAEVIDYTVKNTTVEDYYYTLFDLKEVSGWILDGEKYVLTLTAETATPWVHFIAPLWISNHVSINKVSLYEQADTLILELYGTILGVVESDTLFAKATISYTPDTPDTPDLPDFVIQNFTDSSQLTGDGFFTWKGTLLTTAKKTVGGIEYTGYLFLNSDSGNYIKFNAVQGSTIRIICAAQTDESCIVVNGQEYEVNKEGEVTGASEPVVEYVVPYSGEITIKPSDSKFYICEISYSAA